MKALSKIEIRISLLLIMSVLAIYAQTVSFDFIDFDDTLYVKQNPVVQEGITFRGLIWAFKSLDSGNWHPLTWLSHMLDCEWFGMDSGKHHLINVGFHLANTLLLFVLLNKITKEREAEFPQLHFLNRGHGRLWSCAATAMLFAVHPLHIESVAWVSERKDVLCTLFWLMTLFAWFQYTKYPGLKTYLPVLILMCLGLMAKPMLVTLPVILMLMDFWPLRRFTEFDQRIFQFLYEKIPLFVLSFIFCFIALLAQKQGGALGSLDTYSFSARASNAVLSIAMYLKKTFLPVNLAFFYPYPNPESWPILVSAAILSGISFFCIKMINRFPFLAVGWFWYIITLLPVIGLVQVGLQGMADRYTYIPLIGIFIMITWGLPELIQAAYKDKQKENAESKNYIHKYLFISSSMVILVILMGISWIQTGKWKNTETLAAHALDVTTDNYVAHNCMAAVKTGREKFDHYEKALKIKPDYIHARYNLANAFAEARNFDEAMTQYSEVLRLNPDMTQAHNNFGVILAKQGHYEQAVMHFQKVLERYPENDAAQQNLKKALEKMKEAEQEKVVTP